MNNQQHSAAIVFLIPAIAIYTAFRILSELSVFIFNRAILPIWERRMNLARYYQLETSFLNSIQEIWQSINDYILSVYHTPLRWQFLTTNLDNP
ncbi:hypothetical protein [Myxosarcina sp. GI1(2024)]